MKLRISSLVNDSIVDGRGIRLAVFTQGCSHNCPGCHNPQTHDFAGGKEMDTDQIKKAMAQNPLVDGVTLTGGDPFFQAAPCAQIAKDAHALGLNVWTYTGFLLEELQESQDEGVQALLQETDVLIDGPFLLEERSLELRFKARRNQRLIAINQTTKTCQITLLEEPL